MLKNKLRHINIFKKLYEQNLILLGQEQTQKWFRALAWQELNREFYGEEAEAK